MSARRPGSISHSQALQKPIADLKQNEGLAISEVGQDLILRAGSQPALWREREEGRLGTGPQDEILPHFPAARRARVSDPCDGSPRVVLAKACATRDTGFSLRSELERGWRVPLRSEGVKKSGTVLKRRDTSDESIRLSHTAGGLSRFFHTFSRARAVPAPVRQDGGEPASLCRISTRADHCPSFKRRRESLDAARRRACATS